MKFREIFSFEFAYQLRRPSTWLYFAVMGVLAYLFIWGNFIDDARSGGFYVNAPIIIANVTLFSSLLWLFVGASVAGDAAARDAETRMYSLIYTKPVSKFEYLTGRFMAAFTLNALTLLAVPIGTMIAVHSGGIEPEILGPFRLEAYVGAYLIFALPNVFVATAMQFSLAALSRRSIVSYLASMIIYITAYVVSAGVASLLDQDLGKLLNPLGNDLSPNWTPIEMNERLVLLEGSLLANRLFWIGIALSVFAFAFLRFRLGHPTASNWWSRIKQRKDAVFTRNVGSGNYENIPIPIPQVALTFGFATRLRQTLAVMSESFRTIAKSKSGLVLLTLIAFFLVIVLPLNMESMGIPFFPRTEYVITFLTTPLTNTQTPWVIIPLLIIFWSGELVWREREAGLSEIADATPVAEWVLLLGKFLGLGLMLVIWTALLAIAGVLAQASMNYQDFEFGLYLKVLFGLQLPEYLLFACLVFALHILVNQKYLGHLAALAAYGFIAFASAFGIEHQLLVFSSAPNWSYTDMRGFGSSLVPWLSFKLYWAAWALLLAVIAKLYWVRSRESGFRSRFQVARSRFSGSTAGIGAAALLLITLTGGFIFYNTNILNEYKSASEMMARRAEYERRYGQYENIPQPRITGTNLRVEIYPDRRAADIRGTYRLVNNSTAAISDVHLATSPEVETGEISFDRPANPTLADKELNHRIYTLNEPLQPGDSLNMNFEVNYKPQGFRNGGAEFSVAENGSYFKNLDWFPVIGYQPDREINEAADRRLYNLPTRPEIPSLDDPEGRGLRADGDRIFFEAVVGTLENQTAVAPGALRRTWTEGGRRYFEYATDAPIRNEYAFFSADYAVREGRWNDVAIQIFHHPAHTVNVDRILRSAQASLDYYTKHFGPYPNGYLRFVERPGQQIGMHSDPTTIDYSEGSSRVDPERDSRGLDFVSAVVAHETAHQWWGGSRLTPAYVEGAPLLVESLAWYSALGVMNEAYGSDEQLSLLKYMRETYETPRSRAAAPLLRASGWFLAYRKGPLALSALSRYIGEERVTLALRRLLEKHGSGKPPLPTSLDLYRELQAVTPDSHQYLLRDLFETNTFWELKTERATAVQIKADVWQVTLDVEARKVAVDEKGVETEMSMNDWVEVGVFAPAEDGEAEGKLLYLQMHRLSSGKQTITVEVPSKPDRGGIDPRFLLIDTKTDNNVRKLKID